MGIGGGGGVFIPSVAPDDPNLMFVSCDMGGVYRSTDGGKHWEMLHWRQLHHSLVCRPLFLRDAIIWVSGPSPEFRWDTAWTVSGPMPKISRDKGVTWEPLLANPLPWKGQVICMAADPTDSSVLLFGTDAGELWRSADAGKTWSLSRKGRVYASLGLGKKLYASVGTSFLVSTDKAASWNQIDLTTSIPEARDRTFQSLAGGMADGVTALYGPIYTAGMFQSLDEGKTWKRVGQFRDCNEVVMPANQTRVVYAAQSGNESGLVFRTRDGGAVWENCFRMDAPNPNVEQSWVQTVLHWGYEIMPLGLNVSATDPQVALVSTQGDFYVSQNGGDSWQQRINEVVPSPQGVSERRYRSTGLQVTTCWQMLFDPSNTARCYIAYTDIGFARSEDRGATWSWSARGCPWDNTFYQVVFDPVVKGRMYAATSTRHDIPKWTETNQNGRGALGGVCVSNDSGVTWKPLGKGLPVLPCTSICIDPKSPKNDLTLYTTLFEGGCWKSTDGGLTWTNKSDGLGNPGNLHAYEVFVHPKTGDVYCSITAFRNGDDFPVPGGLWKSSDGGDTWTNLTRDLKLHWPGKFAVNPDNPDVIYLTAATIPGSPEGGIYSTRDGGKTWTQLLKDEDFAATGGASAVRAWFVTLDPNRPDHVYVGTDTHGLWVSADAGKTWKRFEALPFSRATNVAFDPENTGVIYVCTFGGGVWRCPRLP